MDTDHPSTIQNPRKVIYMTYLLPLSSNSDFLVKRLQTQLRNLRIPFVEDFNDAMDNTDHIVDAIFGTRRVRSCAS